MTGDLLGHTVREQWLWTSFHTKHTGGNTMICIGIDAASEKHDVAIINQNGEILCSPFQIRNRYEDYKRLLEIINHLKETLHDDQTRLGIESTGSYSETIVDFFSRVEGVDVIYINPLLTRLYQQTRKVHYAKTDKLDALGIAGFISTEPEIRTYEPVSNDIKELKEIYREIISSNKELCECKNRLKSLLHRYFPEYLEIMSDVYNTSSLWILGNLKSLNSLSRQDPVLYMKKVNKKSKGRLSLDKSQKLIEISKKSVGVKKGYNSVVISSLVSRIIVIQNGKDELLEAAEKLIRKTYPNLLSIPGIGIVSAAGIIGEIGNIDNFHSSDALYAFTGLDPKVYESGKYKAEDVRISKKGSPYLRNAFYIASQCIIHFDPVFIRYYKKKDMEGKRYRNILGHVAKKLCRVVYSLMKSGEDYIISQ